MKLSLEMPVADGLTDGTEFIGPLSALLGVQKGLTGVEPPGPVIQVPFLSQHFL